MKKNNYSQPFLLLFLFLVQFTSLLRGQTKDTSVRYLSINELTAIVLTYHPIAKQTSIQVGKAQASLQIARGAFDPVLSYNAAEKTVDGTSYYAYQQPTLTIPTWFGIEVQTGTEKLQGNRANPTETMGQSSYLGIQIPIGRDLLTDKRRTDLQKAKIAKEASYTEQRKMLNDLLLDMQTAYWEWVRDGKLLNITSEALQTVQKRFQFVKESVRLGDRPAIDTLEAMTQVQQFEQQWNQAQLALQKSQWELSQYLWQENQQPYFLPANCQPTPGQYELEVSNNALSSTEPFLQAARESHPELLLYDFKRKSLEVEKRYRTQQLLPKAAFTYNFLEKGLGWTAPKTVLFENNFQYGVSLAIPLRLSAERGEFKKIKYAIQSVSLEQDLKKWQIENKIRAHYNEVENLLSQVTLQQKALHNFQALLRGEEIRFKIGESSLFLVNARETRAWEAAQKLEEVKTKQLIAYQKLYWAAGLLNK